MTEKVCFDRILPQDLMRPHRRTRDLEGRDRAISPIGKSWMNGSTLRVRFLGGTPAQQATAREQAGWWAAACNIAFDFGNHPPSQTEIRISFDQNDGAWSYVGTDCKGIPANQATMNLGFLDGGTAAHEFGHTIGLAHEHQNPSGGIQWNEPRVLRDLSGPPNFWSEAQIRHNVLRKYSVDQVKGTAFDPHSIMLYFFPAAWTLNGIATKANKVLSAVDKEYVGSAEAYPPTPKPPTGKRLEVNASRRTSASIGTPGEEDLYTFTVEDAGPHVVDTRGATDLVMRLYGPDSQTALVAEDDDSGVGLNPRISAQLVPGTYVVQVRHYRREAGTGSYSIKVHAPQ